MNPIENMISEPVAPEGAEPLKEIEKYTRLTTKEKNLRKEWGSKEKYDQGAEKIITAEAPNETDLEYKSIESIRKMGGV